MEAFARSGRVRRSGPVRSKLSRDLFMGVAGCPWLVVYRWSRRKFGGRFPPKRTARALKSLVNPPLSLPASPASLQSQHESLALMRAGNLALALEPTRLTLRRLCIVSLT